MRIRICLLFACLLFATIAVFAQPTPTALPQLSTATFGWVSVSSLEPTMGQLAAYAPNMLVLRDLNLNTGVELCSGNATYSGFNINLSYAAAMTNLGPGMFRVAHYRYETNRAPLPLLNAQEFLPPDAVSQAEGDATELAYAFHIGKAAVGISYVPQDNTTIQQAVGPFTVLDGTSKTDWGGRIGFVYPFSKKFRFGSEYSYQEGSSEATIYIPDPVPMTEEFITRCLTNGVSWDVHPTTSVYAYLQRLWLIGDSGYKRSNNLLVAGVQHELTKRVTARVGYIDGGETYSLSWRSPVGIFTAIYDHNVLYNARDYLGLGDAALLTWSAAF
ncbi:MAG: hypothetical protein ACYC7E_05330 [Armatimonadota bacterium]